jgi:hypothetical protein
MSVQAANPVAPPQLSLCVIDQATESFPALNGGCRQRSSYEVVARSETVAMAMEFCSRNADENFGPMCVSRFVSRRLLSHGFGALHAPCGNSLFCFGYSPQQVKRGPAGDPDYAVLRITVSLQILFGECAEKISPDPP